jgi:magnesium-transporting ATPase (P-type)
LGVRTFLIFGVIEAALGLAGFFAFFVVEAGWRFPESFAPFEEFTNAASTVTFLSIVGGQVGCLFAQRDGSLLERLSLRSNTLIAVGLVFEISVAIALVYTPVLNGLFSMEAVGPQWLLVLPLAAVIFTAIDQLRRSSQRR